jgi:ABC-type Fe3+-siderophore transport system permease subunit
MPLFSSDRSRFFILIALLLLISLITIWLGPINGLWRSHGLSYVLPIILELRLPRLLAAWLIGSSLATLGVVSQRLFHNQLASPDLLGVSACASLGAFVSLRFFPNISPLLLSFVLSTLVLMPSLMLASRASSSLHFLLSGLAISALASGVLAFLINTSNAQTISQYLFWSMGSLHLVSLQPLLLSGVVLVIIQYYLWLEYPTLDLLAFGDVWASTRGISIVHLRLRLAVVMAVALSLSISLTGPLGFIALIAPHIAKALFSMRHRILIPASALIGALLLTTSDAAGRLLFVPYEIKAGILLNIIGGIYFLWLLLRVRYADT